VAGQQCIVLALRIFLFGLDDQRKQVRGELNVQVLAWCNINEEFFHLIVPSIFYLRSHQNMEVVGNDFC